MDATNSAGNKTILVVEDAEPIRKMVCAMLGKSGYRCLEAADGSEALDLVRAAPQAIDLILTDVVMPHMNGVEMARRAARLRPGMRVLFMSGYSEDPVVRVIGQSPSTFIPKPFTAAALVEKVRVTLEAPSRALPETRADAGAE